MTVQFRFPQGLQIARYVLLAMLLVQSLAPFEVSAERPNIVLVMLDDVGTGWIPPYAERLTLDDLEPEILASYQQKQGHQGDVDAAAHIEAARDCMPFLSKLADEGLVLDNCFATASLCAPSRAGLLTGSFQQKWGAYWNKDVDDHGIPADRVVIAEPLRQAGYRSAVIGKWHVAKKDPSMMEQVWVEEMGESLPIPSGYRGRWPELSKLLSGSGWQSSSFPGQHPLDRGFDYYFGYNSHDSKYFRAQELWENHERVPARPEGEFLTDLFNEKSCDFIASSLEAGKPFFLYYSPMTLHGGIVPPPAKYSAPFDTGNRYTNEYAGHLLALDRGIEMIFETLEKHGQADNTLFLFTSDNGCTLYNVPPYNAPNRGGKGTGWFGGLNVPLVVWQKSLGQQGISAEIVSLADLMPTILDLAGQDLPAGIDGRSLLPFLRGDTDRGPRDSLASASIQSSRWSYFYEGEGENNTRDGALAPLYGWYFDGTRLFMRVTPVRPGLYESFPKGIPAQVKLFDIPTDRQQRQNLAAGHPEQLKVLDTKLRTWLSELKEPISSQKRDFQLLLSPIPDL